MGKSDSSNLNFINDLKSQFKKLFEILNKPEKSEFGVLLTSSIITSIVQSFSVVSLMPFVNVVTNQASIQQNSFYRYLYNFGQFKDNLSFIYFLGTAVIVLLFVSNGLTAVTTYLMNRYVQYRYYSVSSRLLTVYLSRPYEYFLLNNSSSMGQILLGEVNNFVNQYLKNILNLVTNFVMFAILFITLVIVNFKVTFSVVFLFGIMYGGLSVLTRKMLASSGKLLLKFSADRFKSAMEAFNSIKITKSLGIEDFFINRYKKASKKFAHYNLRLIVFSDIPTYLVEIFAFAGIVVVILLIVSRGGDVNSFLPVIGVFALAGYRMLPTITQIYRSYAGIQHSKAILDKIHFDMLVNDQVQLDPQLKSVENDLPFQTKIEFKKCTFNYKDSHTIIDDLDLTIDKGSIIGFAGTTGAGKTTLIDIFLGLLTPHQGALMVDNVKIDESNLHAWRTKIGYVPQEIFLIDDTIRHNIAFGIPETEIDNDKVAKVCKIACISDYIENTLPEKYETIIGERGVRLSGGQRQRLGLARSLYRSPEILILDEATSALDGATEEKVLDGIHVESKVSTMLIIAHRLNTLKICDQIYLLEKGKVVDHGTYNELIENNPQFMKMAKVE